MFLVQTKPPICLHSQRAAASQDHGGLGIHHYNTGGKNPEDKSQLAALSSIFYIIQTIYTSVLRACMSSTKKTPKHEMQLKIKSKSRWGFKVVRLPCCTRSYSATCFWFIIILMKIHVDKYLYVPMHATTTTTIQSLSNFYENESKTATVVVILSAFEKQRVLHNRNYFYLCNPTGSLTPAKETHTAGIQTVTNLRLRSGQIKLQQVTSGFTPFGSGDSDGRVFPQ